MSQRNTIHYFQWVRALGAVAIVLLHAFVTVHRAVDVAALGAARIAAEETISIVLTRWAVPAFFMVSGALMLDPDREMGWRKTLGHVWRLVFVLLTFGFVFCLAESAVDDGALKTGAITAHTVITALHNLARQHSWDHMWFVYELVGYYLMTPLIRPWIAQASREEYGRVVLGTCLLFFVTKTISAFLPYSIYYGVSVPYCFAYYLMGLYVHRYLELDRRWICLGLVSLALTILLGVVLGYPWATQPIRGIVAPYAVMVMLLFKRYANIPLEDYPVIAVLADYSFGIYLIHPAFQHLMVMAFDPLAYPVVVVDAALTLVPIPLSIASIWVLRHIPGFKGKV